MFSTQSVIVIFILVIIIIILIERLQRKRINDIIKLRLTRDLLPPAAEGTRWIQEGACFMSDGSTGKVNGLYCEQIKVL